jgi:hypothetical protein
MGVCAFLLFNHVIMMDDPYEMPRRLNVLQCTYFLFMSGCGEDRSRGIMCHNARISFVCLGVEKTTCVV